MVLTQLLSHAFVVKSLELAQRMVGAPGDGLDISLPSLMASLRGVWMG